MHPSWATCRAGCYRVCRPMLPVCFSIYTWQIIAYCPADKFPDSCKQAEPSAAAHAAQTQLQHACCRRCCCPMKTGQSSFPTLPTLPSASGRRSSTQLPSGCSLVLQAFSAWSLCCRAVRRCQSVWHWLTWQTSSGPETQLQSHLERVQHSRAASGGARHSASEAERPTC